MTTVIRATQQLSEFELTGITDERNHYIVSPDGNRFFVNNFVDEDSTTPLTIIIDWETLLRK